MGALVAVLQTDASLMRCQLARLAGHVTLGGGAADLPPDAYGFGYYEGGSVLLGHRPSGAASLLGLPELAGDVDSEALLAHARRATVGKSREENTHPFRHHQWLFAHDGTISGWPQVKPRLVAALPDFLRRAIGGDTDSEHAFMLFLDQLRAEGRVDDPDLEPAAAARALGRTVRVIESLAREAGEQRPSRLVLAATNGRMLVASRRGGPLYYALFEGLLPCPLHGLGVDATDGQPAFRQHRAVKAVCFANRLTSPNGFIEVPEGSVVAVGRNLSVSVSPI
ncbi:MAG: class II glutamine amidotransferase [Anaeromyxobacter sp.]